jgi:hypothetical protein
MNDSILFGSISSFYEETGEPTEYFWQIDRKIQFGECFKRETFLMFAQLIQNAKCE